ncbi:MAG TPA: SdpI family protein [Erythrobacter sp.]|nr:SdpI family protein [Erythrobacter sp.]
MRGLTILDFVPLFLAAVCLPLALSLIEPNGVYGVRTSATFASEDAWYRANSISGWCGLVAGLAGFAFNWRLSRNPVDDKQSKRRGLVVVLVVAAAMTIPGLLAV